MKSDRCKFFAVYILKSHYLLFCGFYTLACAFAQKYHEMFIIILISSTQLHCTCE